MDSSKKNGKGPVKSSTIAPQPKMACAKSPEKAPCCCKENKGTDPKPSMKKTVVKVQFDCGFPNTLFIRGEGVSALSWNQGVAMDNITSNEWEWECCRPSTRIEFKILINDQIYEAGENHTVSYGDTVTVYPKF